MKRHNLKLIYLLQKKKSLAFISVCCTVMIYYNKICNNWIFILHISKKYELLFFSYGE